MRRLLAGVVALLLAATYVTSAFAQSGSSVRQSGNVTPSTVPYWVTSGVIGGGVTAADSPITSFGVTASGSAGICANSARQSTGAWQALCMGMVGGVPTISSQNYGTAPAQNLQFVINGTPVVIPTGGNTFLFGNGPFTNADVPCFSGTTGLVVDCGLALSAGTVTGGVWQGTAVALGFGGTGANSASGARTNLGLGSMALQNANAVAVTGGSITGMPSPTNASDVAIKSYVDSTSTGLNILAQSRLATAAILPNSPTYSNGASGVGATLTAGSNTTLTVDGTSTALNDVILVKNQASAAQNGIYTQTQVGTGSVPWILTRATYFDQAAEMKAGSYTFITAGSTNVNTAWTMQTAVVTVGTDPANFNLFSSSTGGVSSIAGNTGAFTLTQPINNNSNAIVLNASITPQVRVTLASGTPVMASSQSAATTVYVTPYGGCLVPIYDGTNMIPTCFSEVSQATTDATKSPAAVTTNSIYDIFCWLDSGTQRCTRGPAWTNDTTRSAGTALVLVNGIWLNNTSITNGPGASRGTYVGSIRSDGSSVINYTFGAFSTNCTAGNFAVFNAYNRVQVATMLGISAANWTYAVGNTWREINASSTCQVSQLRGLNEDPVNATYHGVGQPGGATSMATGIGVDSTTAPTGTLGFITSNATFITNIEARFSGYPGLGYHTYAALEFNSAAATASWSGTGGVSYVQTGMHVEMFQ